MDVLRTTPGAYSLEVDESDPSGLVTRTVRLTLYCKYVRRELRSLTLEDREKYLTAAATLWKVRPHRRRHPLEGNKQGAH